MACGEVGEGHAVDAAAHRDHGGSDVAQHGDERPLGRAHDERSLERSAFSAAERRSAARPAAPLALAATSSASALAVRRLARSAILTRTARPPSSTTTARRGRTARSSWRIRRPSVVVSSNDRGDDRLAPSRIGHDADRLDPAPLLADPLKRNHVANPGHAAQAVEADREVLRRLVVDVELDDQHRVRRMPARKAENPEDVGQAGELARPGAGSGGDQAAERGGRPRVRRPR